MLLDNRLLNLDEPGWLYELKYDGHCTLGEFGEGSCRVKTHKCHHPSGAIRVEGALWHAIPASHRPTTCWLGTLVPLCRSRLLVMSGGGAWSMRRILTRKIAQPFTVAHECTLGRRLTQGQFFTPTRRDSPHRGGVASPASLRCRTRHVGCVTRNRAATAACGQSTHSRSMSSGK